MPKKEINSSFYNFKEKDNMSAGAPAIAAISAAPSITAVSQPSLLSNRFDTKRLFAFVDIVETVSHYLRLDDIVQATQVCRDWNVALEANHIWDWQAKQHGVDTAATHAKAVLDRYRSENVARQFNDEQISGIVFEQINGFLGEAYPPLVIDTPIAKVKEVLGKYQSKQVDRQFQFATFAHINSYLGEDDNDFFINAKRYLANPCPAIAYGRYEWMKDFGDPGPVPRLPSSIYRDLRSPDPFQPGKTKAETHLLMLLARRVNDTFVTLKTMGEMMRARDAGAGLGYSCVWKDASKQIGDEPFAQSQWVMMTKDVIEDSNTKNYRQQKRQVEAEGYEVPTIQEAITCIFLENVRSGIRLFSSDNPVLYTRCSNEIESGNKNGQLPARNKGLPAVGNFSQQGLEVVHFGWSNLNLTHYLLGIAALKTVKSIDAGKVSKF
jgi:hypothetical protein